jgi:hypothetical protein
MMPDVCAFRAICIPPDRMINESTSHVCAGEISYLFSLHTLPDVLNVNLFIENNMCAIDVQQK